MTWLFPKAVQLSQQCVVTDQAHKGSLRVFPMGPDRTCLCDLAVFKGGARLASSALGLSRHTRAAWVCSNAKAAGGVGQAAFRAAN